LVLSTFVPLSFSGDEPVLPRPLASDALAKTVAEKGVAAAAKQFGKIRKDPGGEYSIGATEREINALGDVASGYRRATAA
jgi:hypothetical protein